MSIAAWFPEVSERICSCHMREMATRYIVIDPILRSLGWDPSDPLLCRIEYETKRFEFKAGPIIGGWTTCF